MFRRLLLCLLFAGPLSVRAEPAPAGGVSIAEVQRLEAEQGRALRAQKDAEEAAARDAREIERLKGEEPGVGRDLQLQGLLSRAQAQAADLSQKAAQAQRLGTQLRAARQRLIQACDRALADGTQPLTAAQRLDLLRLRAAQVEALAPETAVSPALVRSAAQAAAPGQTQPDDPLVLKERADLLRDSEDKVRREIGRLAERAEELQRRRRLRERADEVDFDPFAEQVVGRRGGQGPSTSKNQGAAAPAAPGGATDAGPGRDVGSPAPTPSPPVTAPTRGSLDPALLDLLRRGEASSDPEVKLLAMRRAQAELQKLADQLRRRATALERRAEELRRRK